MDKFTWTRPIKLGFKIIFVLSFFNSFSQSVDQYKTTTASGSVNVYTIPNADWGEYRTNEKWLVDFTGVTTNSGSATLNRHSLGAKSIKMPDGSDVSSGTLKGRVQLSYNGTYFYIVGGGSSGGGGTCSTCWQTSGTSNISPSAIINTSTNSLFIGNSNSGVHFNTTYASGAAKYALWSTDQTVGNGTAMGVGNLDGGGDGSYAAIIGGAGGNEITMAAANDAGEYAEFWMQANKLGGAFDIILSDHRSTPRGIEYEFAGYENTGSTRTLTSKGYVLGAKTFTGKQTFLTSTTGSASINIPDGSTPTSPSNGDIWGQGNHLFTRLNGVNYQLDQQLSTGIPYVNLASQGSNPAQPSSSISLFSNSSNHFSWMTPADNFSRSFSAGTLTANRLWKLPDASGAIIVSSSLYSTSNYTLTSPGSAQNLFGTNTNLIDQNGVTSNVQSITVPAGDYYFSCYFELTGMSASSGTFNFGLSGTATISSIKYHALGMKVANIGAGTSSTSLIIGTSATVQAVSVGNGNAQGVAIINGILHVSSGGTIIPQVGVSVSATPVVNQNSYFKISSN